MQDDHSKEKSDTGNFRITFPPPQGLELKAGQKIVVNGRRATVRQTADGQLEIDNPEFIQHLIQLGFRPGHNNSAERLEEISKTIPDEYKKDFFDGAMGKPRK